MKTKNNLKTQKCVNCGYPMLTPKEYEIFWIMYNKLDKWFTPIEISCCINSHHSTTCQLLSSMTNKNVLTDRKCGKNYSYTLNKDYLDNHNIWE